MASNPKLQGVGDFGGSQPHEKMIKARVSLPCEIESADFEANTITIKMMTRDFAVSAGPRWLCTAPPKPEPQPVLMQERRAKRMSGSVVTEWSKWYASKYDTPDEAKADEFFANHIPHEWRHLCVAAHQPQSGPAPGDWLDVVKTALPNFRQQDDFLSSPGAPLMSDEDHEIIHIDTVQRIAQALAQPAQQPGLKLDAAGKATILAALTHYLREGQGDPARRTQEVHELAVGPDDCVISLDDAGIQELIDTVGACAVDEPANDDSVTTQDSEDRKFFETVVTVRVLSENAPVTNMSLFDVAYEIGEGPCVGRVEFAPPRELTCARMAARLSEFGSERGFFQIKEAVSKTSPDVQRG